MSKKKKNQQSYLAYVAAVGDEMKKVTGHLVDDAEMDWQAAPLYTQITDKETGKKLWHVLRQGKYIIRCNNEEAADALQKRLNSRFNGGEFGKMHLKIKRLPLIRDLSLSITDAKSVTSRSKQIKDFLIDEELYLIQQTAAQLKVEGLTPEMEQQIKKQQNEGVATLEKYAKAAYEAADGSFRLRWWHGKAYRLSFYDDAIGRRHRLSLGDVVIYVSSKSVLSTAAQRKEPAVDWTGWQRVIDFGAFGNWELLRWHGGNGAKKDIRI